jgi:hypothetical protein
MLFFALIYAVIFWVVAFKRPFYGLVLVWALAPIQTDLGIGGAKFSLTELHLLLLMPLLLLRLREARGAANLGPLAWPIGTYLLISLFSSLVHWRGSDALISMLQMVLYIVFTVQIFSTMLPADELRRIPQTLLVVSSIWSIIGVATHFDFIGHRKNAFGSALAVAFLVAFDLWLAEPKGQRRNWIMVGGTVIFMGLILSLSRGAWLGAISGMLVIIMLRRASYVMMRACVVALPLLFICWNLVPEKQQAYAVSFDTSRYNIKARLRSLSKAQQAFAEDPMLGVGVGLRKQYDATNLLWTSLAETGVVGTLAFAWIFVAFYRLAWRTRARLDAKDPCFCLLTIGAALMTCKLMHGMVDHYWSRGAITQAWGGAGMVLVASRLPAQRAIEAARALAQQKRLARQQGSSLTLGTSQDSGVSLRAGVSNGTNGNGARKPFPIHAYAPVAPAALVSSTTSESAWQDI